MDIVENRIYLNHTATKNFAGTAVKDTLLNILHQDERIAYAIGYGEVRNSPIPSAIQERISRGYTPQRSGDIQIILQPGYYEIEEDSFFKGTSHSTWCPYDSHIPLIFYGWSIPQGNSDTYASISDIAATLATKLSVQVPNGCIGTPLQFNR